MGNCGLPEDTNDGFVGCIAAAVVDASLALRLDVPRFAGIIGEGRKFSL